MRGSIVGFTVETTQGRSAPLDTGQSDTASLLVPRILSRCAPLMNTFSTRDSHCMTALIIE